jgi:uncharacterized membrane protein YkvI
MARAVPDFWEPPPSFRFSLCFPRISGVVMFVTPFLIITIIIVFVYFNFKVKRIKEQTGCCGREQ